MAQSLGSLVVSLGLDAAQYTTGLTKAEADARRFGERLGNNIKVAAEAATIALSFLAAQAVAAFVAIDQLGKNAGHFQDLAEKVGASAEEIASFAVAAHVAGTSMDDLAAFSIKLSKNMADVEQPTSKTGAALRALGIDIKAFKALDPAAQLDALAKAQARFAEGGGKTSAFESIAKGGAQLLPFLKELNAEGGRTVILTEEQIRVADAYSDAQARAKAQLQLYVEVAAVEALPAITAVTNAAKEFIKEVLGMDQASGDLASNNAILTWADGAAKALAFLIDAGDGVVRIFQVVGTTIAAGAAQAGAVASGEFKRAIAIGKEWSQEVDRILARQTFASKLNDQIAARRGPNDFAGPPAPPKPSVKFNGVDLQGTAVAKALLDGQLKAQEDFIKSEQDLLNDRERFLQSYYQADQISLRDFYDARRSVLNEAFDKESAAYDAELVILRKAAKTATPADRVTDENKIAEVIAKRARLQQDVGAKSIQLWLDEQRAVQQLTDSIEQAGIALAEMRGDTVTAAAASFDFANRKFQAAISGLQTSANPDDQARGAIAQKTLDATRALTIIRAQLADVTKTYSLSLDGLGIAQARIDIAEQSGATTALGALRARSDLAAQYTQTLTIQLQAVEAIAKASGRPEDIIRVEQLRVQLEQLAATGDLVAKKFNDIGSSAFSTFLTDIVSGTKSVKQAFLDMAKSIEQSIQKIASDEISQQLFGKGGAGSGFGDFFSKIFGGKGSSKDAAGATGAIGDAAGAAGAATSSAALTALAATTTATDISMATLTASAAAAAAALETVAATSAASSLGGAFGGGGGGDLFGTLFSGLAQGGGLANGTDNWRGGLTMVGERGPELVNLPRGARVMPSDQTKRMMAGGGPVNITVAVNGNVSTETANQTAVKVANAVRRAQRFA